MGLLFAFAFALPSPFSPSTRVFALLAIDMVL
jgi:hypothetical protein